jgi:hypothetical protein
VASGDTEASPRSMGSLGSVRRVVAPRGLLQGLDGENTPSLRTSPRPTLLLEAPGRLTETNASEKKRDQPRDQRL